MRVDNMTDREIVAACAVDLRRKAQEAYDAYQGTGMKRYDNAYHKIRRLWRMPSIVTFKKPTPGRPQRLSNPS